MKLESTLKEKPGLMHIAPVLDVVLILLIFFLLGSAFMVRSGVSVSLPRSSSTLEGFASSRVVTISAGIPATILLDGESVTLSELGDRLGKASRPGGGLVIRADELATHGVVMEISNLAIAAGYSLAIATSPPSSQ